ncbi:choice-of-anchor tandem repeat NxxGxxAF-containing protein [Nostoc commune]|uniref:DUF7453 family protein n=1 Tax=Nostoc commune TaxID=1178 RepID=UPI0018C51085|nr:choice-of-anchor tandem repeat NxxGxxAF-containing protein [Nostoc commune]MBG1263643.1 hypothetical protein [Nostoc commune BAE]
MNSYPKILGAIAGTFLSLVTIDVNSAQAGNFTFTSIVNVRDNKDFFNAGGSFFDVGGGPINDNGTVAFAVVTSNGEGIFTSNGGGAFTTVLKPSPRLSSLNGLAINNSDTVAFGTLGSDPQGSLFISKDGNITKVAALADFFELNNNDTLVFTTFDDLFNKKIVTANGGLVTTVVDTSGSFSSFDQNTAINDSNVVAFQATLKDGRSGVFTIKDGTITTIADNTSFSLGGFFGVGINNTGTVIFNTPLGSKESKIFRGSGEAITTVADTIGSFSGLIGGVINDNNQVAFGATLLNGAKNVFSDGIFTGSDPVADKVIAIGDSLLGGTVTNVLFEDLNNSGQISFLADFIDDSGKTFRGVFRADPVSKSIPESTSTLGLLAFGALGTGLTLKRKLKQI